MGVVKEDDWSKMLEQRLGFQQITATGAVLLGASPIQLLDDLVVSAGRRDPTIMQQCSMIKVFHLGWIKTELATRLEAHVCHTLAVV